MEKKPVGKIAHFYPKINVAVVELTDNLKVGDKISIEAKEQAFEQTVDSMQIEHEQIQEAKAGQAIGLRVTGRVHEGNAVYKLVE
jgi:translation elongation factor EF-1alpha